MRGVTLAAAIFLLAVFALSSVQTASMKSNTWDEPAHVLAGYAYLTEHMDHLSPLHHPAAGRGAVAVLPATLLDLNLDTDVDPEWAPGSNFMPYSVEFLHENISDGKTVLLLARLGNVLLGLLMGVYVFLWSRRLWGEGGAVLSLFLFALSPNLIAHSALATTDVPGTAFFFITLYYLYLACFHRLTPARVVAAGVFTGLALTSKHTTLLLVPISMVFFAAAARRAGAGKTAAGAAGVAVSALVTIWAVYGFAYHGPEPLYQPPPWEEVSGHALAPVVEALRSFRALPEAYLYSLSGVLKGAGSGRAAYLMAEQSGSGWWHYFLVAFLVKTPVPAIFFLAATVIYSAGHGGRVIIKKAWPVALPMAVVFLAVSAQRVNIGLRHMLPFYPLLFVLLGSVPTIKTDSARAARLVFAGACLWYAVSFALIHPHHLAYFNEFAGGPRGGRHYLVDSNLDWGQDLTTLGRYMDENGIDRVKLGYFGLSDPGYYGVEYQYLPSYAIPEPLNVEDVVELEGWFAVSATLLQGMYLPGDHYAFFREAEPVETLGYSIYLYHFPGGDGAEAEVGGE